MPNTRRTQSTPRTNAKMGTRVSTMLAENWTVLLLVPAVLFAASVRLGQQLANGPSWDTFAFLSNAAEMAGRSVGYVEPHRPPFLPFLTSLALRAGAWDTATIQVIDAALVAFGVLAFYFLLRRRLGQLWALAGGLLLVVLPPVWRWMGVGYTDFPSVALSIWAFLLFVKSTEDDPRWYWLALPVAMAATLTRFSALLMVLPVGLWMLLRSRPFRDAKHMAIGAAAAVAVYIPAGFYFSRYFNNSVFPLSFANQVSDGIYAASEEAASAAGGLLAYVPGHWYIENLTRLLVPESLGAIGFAFLLLTFVGLVAMASRAFSSERRSSKNVATVLVGLAGIVYTQSNSGSMLRLIAIFAFALICVRALCRPDGETSSDPRVPAGCALDAAMLVWGLAYFDAHSHMEPQLSRYFLTMAPAALYFVLRAWSSLGASLRRWVALDGRPKQNDVLDRIGRGLALSAVLLIALAAFGTTVLVDRTFERDSIVAAAENTASWLRNHDSDLDQAVVYSDMWPLSSWYLGLEARDMPFFEDSPAFAHELEKSGAKYFITIRGRRYDGYNVVYQSGPARVLERESPPRDDLPEVLYIGDGWDAYLERLTDYEFELLFSSRRRPTEGTWLLDGMTADQLAEYDAVAIFGARWKSIAEADRVLREYVAGGGALIVDASRNLGGLQYSLADTVFLDMVVRRREVPRTASVVLNEELSEAAKLPSSFNAADFVDETGGPWYGAGYSALDGAKPEVLATVGAEPLVLRTQLGAGEIYWISGNFVWHAFLTENQAERDLVRGVTRLALDGARDSAATPRNSIAVVTP